MLRLGDRIAYGQPRIERRERVLEDHLMSRRTARERTVGKRRDVAALDRDGPTARDLERQAAHRADDTIGRREFNRESFDREGRDRKLREEARDPMEPAGRRQLSGSCERTANGWVRNKGLRWICAKLP